MRAVSIVKLVKLSVKGVKTFVRLRRQGLDFLLVLHEFSILTCSLKLIFLRLRQVSALPSREGEREQGCDEGGARGQWTTAKPKVGGPFSVVPCSSSDAPMWQHVGSAR